MTYHVKLNGVILASFLNIEPARALMFENDGACIDTQVATHSARDYTEYTMRRGEGANHADASYHSNR
jgi:hypothetical protein